MSATPVPSELFHVTDPSTGLPLVGGKVHTYITETTTNKLTWSDKDQVAENDNPVVLDANGDAPIFISGIYKFIVNRADDTLVYELDGISGGSASGLDFDVQVDDLADRAAYDTEVTGFRVLVSDTGDGRAAIYSKNSSTSGDWSAPAYITGPFNPGGDVQVITIAGTVVVGATDGVILLNKAAPSSTAITLPAVAGRNRMPLIVADIGGNAGDIVFTPDGTEKIMGLSSMTLVSNGQGAGLAASVTLYPATEISGWFVG